MGYGVHRVLLYYFVHCVSMDGCESVCLLLCIQMTCRIEMVPRRYLVVLISFSLTQGYVINDYYV